MKHQTGRFHSANTDLFYQSWFPDGESRAVILIVHGGGDHSGRFGNVTDYFLPAGYGIFMFDLRGHGQSPGKRGHINSWEEYRHDLKAFLEFVHGKVPGLPKILMGHSMGGALVLDYCLRVQHHIHAVLVTSPAIGKLGISPFLIGLARIMDKVWPSLVLPTGLVVPHLSRDSKFILKTQADPLYHSLSTPRFGMELLRTISYIQSNAANFALPLYLIHGTGDLIASIAGSRQFVKNVNPGLITYKEYEGGYHELFNDLDKATVLQDMKIWLECITASFP